MLKNEPIVDADGHIMEPASMWQDYIEPEYRERSIRIVRDESDGDKLLIDGALSKRIRRLGGLPYSQTGESVNWDSLSLTRFESYKDSCHPASYDPSGRLKWMDAQGIDVSVLFPSLGLIWPREVAFEPGYIRAHQRAYNRWIFEFSRTDSERLIPVAQTSLFEEQRDVRDLVDLREMGFHHIMLPLLAPDSESCFTERFDYFWKAVRDMGFVVYLHKVAIPHQLNIPTGEPLGGRGNGSFFTHVNEILAAQMCLASLMDNRMPDRFPEIRFAFLECNAGWVPPWLDRADESYEVLQSSGKAPLLAAPPRHYIENTDCFFFGLSLAEDPMRLQSIANRLLVSTDFPHPGASTNPVADWTKRLENLSPEDRAGVMGFNAMRLLNDRAF